MAHSSSFINARLMTSPETVLELEIGNKISCQNSSRPKDKAPSYPLLCTIPPISDRPPLLAPSSSSLPTNTLLNSHPCNHVYFPLRSIKSSSLHTSSMDSPPSLPCSSPWSFLISVLSRSLPSRSLFTTTSSCSWSCLVSVAMP